MGKSAVSIISSLALVVLLAFSVLQPACAAERTTVTCSVDSLVLEDQYRISITMDHWSSYLPISELGLIVVPPAKDSPESEGNATHYNFSDDVWDFNIEGYNIRVSYEPNSTQERSSEGDQIVIQSMGTSGLPQGQWQVYLVQVDYSGSIFGIVWTLGNELSQDDYNLPYARSSITDPLEHFFPNPSTNWVFVSIFMGEAALLAVIVFLISRTK